MISPRNRSIRGLARKEALWTLLGFALIALVILKTFSAELEAAKAREAQDMVEILAAHLHINFENQANNQEWWKTKLPAVGPGTFPSVLEGITTPLMDFLPHGFPLTADPWGHAYILGPREIGGRIAFFVFSTGPSGVLPENPRNGLPWIREILGPASD